MEQLQLLLGYTFLGGAIKYVDMAYDDNVFSRRKAFIVAVISGIIGGYMMVADLNTTVIFSSILIGLALTKKIDNIAFACATGIAAAIFVSGLLFTPMEINLPALALLMGFLASMAIADEVGNDFADRHYFGGLQKKIMYFRPAMKVGMLGLVALGFFNWIYFLAFMLFDGTYESITLLSKRVVA